jgi:hypothetical protein
MRSPDASRDVEDDITRVSRSFDPLGASWTERESANDDGGDVMVLAASVVWLLTMLAIAFLPARVAVRDRHHIRGKDS